MKLFSRYLVPAGLALGLPMMTLIAAEPANLEQADKDLKIMRNIFQTVLEEQTGERGRRSYRQEPEALYLPGQGLVFTFDMDNMNSFFSNIFSSGQFDNFKQLNQQVIQLSENVTHMIGQAFPDIEVDVDGDFKFDYDDSSYRQNGSDPRFVGRADPNLSSRQRELQDSLIQQIRIQENKVQDEQRTIRKLQNDFQAGLIKADELNRQMSSLEQDLEPLLQDLESKHDSYSALMDEIEEQKRNQSLALNQQLSMQIIQGLCDYGATIRSLKDNEFVSLVFESFDSEQKKRQVYVFPYKDVSDCSSAEKLMLNASVYLM